LPLLSEGGAGERGAGLLGPGDAGGGSAEGGGNGASLVLGKSKRSAIDQSELVMK
jgi:hypothetical protein